MKETENVVNGGTAANSTPEGSGGNAEERKLFTQEEVNKIISERLSRERAKAEPSEQETREAELSNRENRIECREYLLEKKYRAELLDILDTTDAKKFKQTVDKLTEIIPGINESKPHFAPQFTAPMHSVGSIDPVASAFKPKI